MKPSRVVVPAAVFAAITLAALPAHAQRRDHDHENRGQNRTHPAEQENHGRAVERGPSNDRGHVEAPRQVPTQRDHRSFDAPRSAVPREFPRVERSERPRAGSAEPFRSDGNRSDGFRSDGNRSDRFRSDGNRSDRFRSDGNRSDGFRSDGNRSDRFRSDGNRSDGFRSDRNRSDGFRSDGNRSFGNRSDNFRSNGNRSYGYRSDGYRSYGNRSYGYRSDGYRSYGNRSYGYPSYRYGSDRYRSYGYGGYGYRPYGYVFRPRFRIGLGLFLGYPVPYPVYESYGYSAGGVSFEISPVDALVYVDGGYAGVVDDFYDRPLSLASGRHRIELQATGYVPLIFEVDVVPGQVLPYRGDLQRY